MQGRYLINPSSSMLAYGNSIVVTVDYPGHPHGGGKLSHSLMERMDCFITTELFSNYITD